MQIGKWPVWLDFLLTSAAHNKLATFYFVGSAPLETAARAPQIAQCTNCVWLPLNHSGFLERMRAHLGVEMQIHTSRRNYLKKMGMHAITGQKLKDLKPCIGALFPELASRHKWIGYIDPDVILGNLSYELEHLSDDADLLVPLERFPQPLANGNFLLMRTVPRVLQAFRHSSRWREALQQENAMAFDEWHFEGEERRKVHGKVDYRYFGSSYAAWHGLFMGGLLRPQPARRFFVQDAIIQLGVQGSYATLDSYGATVNLTWRAGQLSITRRGPCVCPNDVISQLGIASCAECIKFPGKVPRIVAVNEHGVGIRQHRRVQLDRTVEILGFHFQMWKKIWHNREFRILNTFHGVRPAPDAVRMAIPACRLEASPDRDEFYLDQNGFSCSRLGGYAPWSKQVSTVGGIAEGVV